MQLVIDGFQRFISLFSPQCMIYESDGYLNLLTAVFSNKDVAFVTAAIFNVSHLSGSSPSRSISFTDSSFSRVSSKYFESIIRDMRKSSASGE